jgi:hypothetical protein
VAPNDGDGRKGPSVSLTFPSSPSGNDQQWSQFYNVIVLDKEEYQAKQRAVPAEGDEGREIIMNVGPLK